jgi:hypothetical protein
MVHTRPSLSHGGRVERVLTDRTEIVKELAPSAKMSFASDDKRVIIEKIVMSHLSHQGTQYKSKLY